MQAFFRRTRHKLSHAARAVNQFMTVPMWSACISIVVAMIPPLQATLVRTKPLTQAITSAGQCSSESSRGLDMYSGTWQLILGTVPLTLVVLGAFFYSPPPPATEPQPPSTLQKIKQTLGLAPREPSRSASKPAAAAAVASSTTADRKSVV